MTTSTTEELYFERSLLPGAIEEILRFEPPALPAARYVDDAVFSSASAVRGWDSMPARV